MSEHTEHDAKADRLQDLISEKLFDRVCDARLVRSDRQRFDVEDSDPEMYPPDEYPVVYLDAEGRRYSVEVEVTVSPLLSQTLSPRPTFRFDIDRRSKPRSSNPRASCVSRHTARRR